MAIYLEPNGELIIRTFAAATNRLTVGDPSWEQNRSDTKNGPSILALLVEAVLNSNEELSIVGSSRNQL